MLTSVGIAHIRHAVLAMWAENCMQPFLHNFPRLASSSCSKNPRRLLSRNEKDTFAHAACIWAPLKYSALHTSPLTHT